MIVSLLGVVVGVSELLLISLAKMTVQVGKTVGQVVSDSKVCHNLPHPHCVSSPPSMYVITSLIVCHILPHCMSLPPSLYVTTSLIVCHILLHCMSSSMPSPLHCMSQPPSLYVTVTLPPTIGCRHIQCKHRPKGGMESDKGWSIRYD